MRRQITSLILLLSLPALAMAHDSTKIPDDPRNVNPVEVGSTLPDPSLESVSGEQQSLKDIVRGQKSVIIFYRGSWCPYCTKHLAAIGQHEQAILDKGYRILAISPDKVERIQEHEKEADLNYTLYSDADMTAATAFGLTFKLDDPTLEKLESYDIDIEAASGRKHHLLPVPAVFVSDKNGRITFRYFNPDYSKRLSPEALLDALK